MSESIKVLIVDDKEDNRIILKSSIRKISNISIFEAIDGQDAIDKSREIKPEIILMDVMMPNVDGIEATKVIKEELEDVVVLVITAIEDSQVEENLLEIGANAYIRKPIDRKILHYKIRNFIELIKIKKDQSTPMHSIGAINIFSKKVRCFKTHFVIRDEENVMDFGSWLIDVFSRYNAGATFKFDKTLDLLYGTLYTLLEGKKLATIIIEDDFETLYLSIDTQGKTLHLKNMDLSNDEVVQKDGILYFKIPYFERPLKAKRGNEQTTNESIEARRERREIEEHERDIIQKSCHDGNVISAALYIENLGDDFPDEIHDLKELLEHWGESISDLEFNFSDENMQALSDSTLKISSILNKLYDFISLGYAISSLSIYIKNVDISKFDERKKTVFVMVLKHIKDDLSSWWSRIFIERDAENIHYLDSSLYSSCLQLEALFDEKEIDGDDEIELF